MPEAGNIGGVDWSVADWILYSGATTFGLTAVWAMVAYVRDRLIASRCVLRNGR